MGDFNIDYTGRDYQSLLDKADAFAKEILPEWTSRDDNDINWATVKTIAYLLSIGMFYIDLGVNEQDPFEVQIYRNALKLARRYGMPVRKVKGATTMLSITIAEHTEPKTLYRGTLCVSGAMKYVVLEDVYYPVGTNTMDVPVQFGLFERYLVGTSDGTDYQKFVIDRDDVQDKAVRIFIDEGTGFEEWETVDTLLLSYEDDKHVRLILNEYEKYELNFGDNKSGKRPIESAEIEVEIITMPTGFVESNYGNLPSGNITVCQDTLAETVLQEDDATGGENRETIASIGRNLPQWVSTSDRAISERDYEYLAKRVAGVADANAILDALDMTCQVYVVPVGGGLASDVLRNQVFDYLRPRAMPQFDINVMIPTPVGITVSLDLTIEDTFTQSVVVDKVYTAIATFLDAPVDIGRVIKVQDIYDVIRSVQGVKLSLVTELFRTGEASALQNVDLLAYEVSSVGLIDITPTGGIV